MSTLRWEAELHRLAQHLAGQRRAVGSGELAAVEAFVPEPGLGPLPVALAARARELQAQSQALQQCLQEARDRTATALTTGAAGRSPGGSPAYLDSRG